jgi:DNA-binding transcriptional MerR regulator
MTAKFAVGSAYQTLVRLGDIMTDLLSINTVAAKLGLSVHQLRRWELMFGLEIKRGRGQQRQYRPEDMTVLERIKELVEQGWPTSQIRPQLEAEGLITPKLIGMPQAPGNPEMLMEALIGFRSFAERRFIELSRQIDELRQLMISITLKQELKGEVSSPWQPLEQEFEPAPMPALPPQEIHLGPPVQVAPAAAGGTAPPKQESQDLLGLGEITDQNYLTVLGRALDLVGWTDERADEFASKTFGISHWDELGRSQAEKLIGVLQAQKPTDAEATPS